MFEGLPMDFTSHLLYTVQHRSGPPGTDVQAGTWQGHIREHPWKMTATPCIYAALGCGQFIGQGGYVTVRICDVYNVCFPHLKQHHCMQGNVWKCYLGLKLDKEVWQFSLPFPHGVVNRCRKLDCWKT